MTPSIYADVASALDSAGFYPKRILDISVENVDFCTLKEIERCVYILPTTPHFYVGQSGSFLRRIAEHFCRREFYNFWVFDYSHTNADILVIEDFIHRKFGPHIIKFERLKSEEEAEQDQIRAAEASKLACLRLKQERLVEGKKMGALKSAATKAAKRLNGFPYGSMGGRPKLDIDVEAIKAKRREEGLSYRKLALHFKISATAAFRAVHSPDEKTPDADTV